MAGETILGKIHIWVSKCIWIILSITMGATSYMAAVEIFPYNSTLRLISIFTIAPMFFFFVIFVHEMGHAIAAWALKYRVHFIAVGTFGFNPEKRRFQRAYDFSKNEIAGFILYSPEWPIKDRWGEIIVSFCGPLATIILGLLFLTVRQSLGYFSHGRTALMLLAIVCFLDAAYNLLPLKSGRSNNSDGRNIWESLFKTMWTPESWVNVRAYAASHNDQVFLSDKEWTELRQECLRTHSDDLEFGQFLRPLAWYKTDPEAFVAIMDKKPWPTGELSNHVIWQYIVSRILVNRYDKDLIALMPDTIDKGDHIYLFARVLLDYASGDHDKAMKTVVEVRQAFKRQSGNVPPEEEAIFTAIENKTPLPDLVWEALVQ